MKFFRFVLSVLIILPLLSACGAATKPASSPLRIAVVLWPGMYPAAIAQEQGFFAKHNLNVKVIYYNSYLDTYADLLANKVDAAIVVAGDALPLSTQKNVKFIFPVDASDGADQIIAGSAIKSASDLKGKKIGVGFGTYADLLVRTLLKQNGVAATDVQFVNVAAENASAFFPSAVDAIHTYDPYTSELIKKGGHVLFTSHETPGLVLDLMVVPSTLVKDRPEDVQSLTDAWFEAVDWMSANPGKVPAVVAKVFGVKAEDVWLETDKVFNRAESKALMQPGENSSSAYFIIQTYIDFLVTSGELSTKPKLENLMDPSFLK